MTIPSDEREPGVPITRKPMTTNRAKRNPGDGTLGILKSLTGPLARERPDG